ncbi:polysaccharide export protein [Diaporthe amygdali]|uniref:polysaccharide export protein n=1 Tax=Phomopsis amygdali TaxID=1214568 RepID=UPI0022FE0C2C|nr:polysaccharide export protein [Diaporthe amygdali]KAJ0107851.1 polysaccharide export protein [Diaporthe amygdali]
MIISSRLLLRRLRQRRRPLLSLLLFLFTIDVILLLRHRPRTSRVTIPSLERHGLGSDMAAPAAAGNETFFIVSVHRNTGDILPAWSSAVLALIDHLGPENVYFSALESGSQDDTKDKLTALKARLDARHVPNTVTLGQTVWQQLDEMWARPAPDAPRQEGWIWNQEDNVYDLRRITYLARERNRAMEPMRELQERQGVTFDKVLWLNDVIFDVEDFLTLLHTRGGAYAAACSMDYKRPPAYYDTFALRDGEGRKTASNYWPWFQGGPSRAAALRSEPVRVASCWNGMVIFDAAPFLSSADDGPPLRFRAIPDALADLHLEGSECCLVHADNPLSAAAAGGVWLNPNVRVGYSVPAYNAVRARHGEQFPGAWATVTGAWANRWLRWRGSLSHHVEGATVAKRLRQWVADAPEGEPRREPGVSCLINEKQIMWMNGWRHL